MKKWMFPVWCFVHEMHDTEAYRDLPWMAQIYGLREPTFERMITNFVELPTAVLYNVFVEKTKMISKKSKYEWFENLFRNFSCAIYAIEVTFHHINCRAGNIEKTQPFHSAKQKLFGYITDVLVLMNGMAMNCSPPYRGKTRDVDMFRFLH